MDATIKRNHFENKVITAITNLKMLNIEKILSDLLDSVPNDSAINYVGELNKSDIMH